MRHRIRGIGGIVGLVVAAAIPFFARCDQLTALELERSIGRGKLTKHHMHGLSPEAVNCVFSSGYTPLTLAVYLQRPVAIRLLLQAGADPNEADKRGVTPLQEAVAVKNTPVFKYLVMHGALLNPCLAAAVAAYDPLASYIYHAVRIIRLGDCLDGHNCINNITTVQAQELLSSLATHADTLTELRRAVLWGANVNFTDADGSTIVATAQMVNKPELIRYARTQGLRAECLGAYIACLSESSPWLTQEMLNKEAAFERLASSIAAGGFDYDTWDIAFKGPYGQSVIRLVEPTVNLDLLAVAAHANNHEATSFLISHGATTKKNAERIVWQHGYTKLGWFLHKHR